MRTVVAWADKVHDREGTKQCIYDLSFRPDGTQLIAAAGSRVLVYETADGDLIQSLKGHKDSVYCTAFSSDGKRFASGGADRTVIVWTNKLEGILKYSHNDAITALQYNPLTMQLASCTSTDFGLWSPEQKSVAKHKVNSKILACSWTNDGQFLAVGMYSGVISIRDKEGEERVRIERPGPVWCMSWNPSRDEPCDILAVGDWSQKLSFYQLSGRQVGKDRDLGYDPCSIGYFTNGEYLVVGGSDRKASLWTKEGVKLTAIGDRDDWVWACRPRPKQNFVAVGCNDGTIAMYQLIFSTVHGLYQDRYAYRDFMTDVIIQHLITEQKVRIKCRDYVKKIAIYKDRLAVQLPDRIVIYELFHDDAADMHYRVRDKIMKKLECNLLVVTSNHIILCQEKTLQLYDFQGNKDREWVQEALIRYIKVVGGPTNREGLLVGLKNGYIIKIFIDNQFPIQLIKQSTSIRCLDLSSSRTKLAVVDELNNCLVYNLSTKELLFQEANANSVAWNTELEDMLCFSGNGLLNIKAGTFPVHSQKMQGFVVGFKGSKIFCLHIYAMQAIDVPQSASLYRYLEKKDFDSAYKVACLGVTDSDWRLLATDALQALQLDVARRSFIRIKDVRYIELINYIEQQRKLGKTDEQIFLGDILAYQGKYHEAAKVYAKAGHVQKAVDLYSELRMYEDAKRISTMAKDQNVDIKNLINRQAEWNEELGDTKSAIQMFLAAGQHTRAIQLIGEQGWDDQLMDVARKLNKNDKEALSMAASFFRKHGNHPYAKEMYVKMEDNKSLLDLHVSLHKWDEAHSLLKLHPEYTADVKLPYANWLAMNDQFDKAQITLREAGKPEEALRILERLTHNAVLENRFEDAATYFWKLHREALGMVANPPDQLTPEDEKHIARAWDLHDRAQVYYAYHFIYRYTDEPFTTILPENLFNMARFILNRIQKSVPVGISKVYTLYALAKMSKQLGAFKLARVSYDKLQALKIPDSFADEIDVASVTVRSRPYSDKEDLLPICCRCSATNPLLNNQGDKCVQCCNKFIYSFHSFDNLPMMEIFLDDDIEQDEAERLIKQEPLSLMRTQGGDTQTMTVGDDDDAFTKMLNDDIVDYDQPVRVNREMLRALPTNEVFIVDYGCVGLRHRYFKSMIPEVPITKCPTCHLFFHEEDWEMAILQKGCCPMCRTKQEISG